MSAAIEKASPVQLGFRPQSIEQAMSLASTLSKSALIPKALQGRPADVLIVLLTAQELGIGPMQGLRGINVIDGKAVMAADLIVALCVQKREVCEWFRLVESTPTKATYEAKRVGSEPATLSFAIEEARQAGLLGKNNWKNYPAAMLRARCSAGLARAVFPDLASSTTRTKFRSRRRRGQSCGRWHHLSNIRVNRN